MLPAWRIHSALRRMLERLMAQVRASGVEVRRLVLGIRYTDREEARRTVDLAEPTALEAETWHLLPEMLKGAWTRRVRGSGCPRGRERSVGLKRILEGLRRLFQLIPVLVEDPDLHL